MIFVANLEHSKKKVKFEDSSKLKTWIREFSGMMLFLGAISLKNFCTHVLAKMETSLEWVWSLLQTQERICVHKVFLRENMRAQGLFKLKKTFCTHIFFWVWSTLQTQGLSLECAPNSRLSLERLQTRDSSLKFAVFQTRVSSLECAPNSRFEFGVRSKLEVWVWSTLQTRGLSLEYAPNSLFEFGVRSKLGFWV